MKRSFLIICALVIAAMTAFAQNPIRWRMNVKMTSETEGVVTLRALVDEGWHLYSTNIPEGGPKATTISFEGSKGVKFTDKVKVSPAPTEVDDPMFEMKLAWWATNATFTRKFKITDPASARIEASVSFMGCNDMNCMPPKTVNLTHEFKK